MQKINKEEAGWVVALSWLSALEETARDFHGTRPRMFCERAYEHSVQHFLHRLGDEYGIRVGKATSIIDAISKYIEVGVAARVFRDASDFELVEANPFKVDITIHECKYLKSCRTLIEQGMGLRDLTCARIGCFRAAVRALSNLDADYQVTSFDMEGDCKGYIERR